MPATKESDVPELKTLDQLNEELADNVQCPTCDGEGKIMGGNRQCPDCGGTGEQKTVQFDLMRRTGGIDPELRAVREGMRNGREERRMPLQGFEMREVSNGAGGTELVCNGYASVTCADRDDDSHSYEMEDAWGPWIESTVRGFAAKTINENCDTAFLVNHGGVSMARTKPGTLRLSEDLKGLHYEAHLNPSRPDVQILRAAVDDKAIDESSFAFRVTRQEWNENYDRRWITEVSLDKGDVSPVNFGASPRTADYPLSMRGHRADAYECRRFMIRMLEVHFGLPLPEIRQLARGEQRAGATLSAATMIQLQSVLDLVDASDTNVDNALIQLSALMGVVNPDIAQDAALDRDEPDADDSGGSAGGDEPGVGEPVSTMSHGLFVPDFRVDRARLEALRHRRSA
jgi:HK97 family phage prohead protease